MSAKNKGSRNEHKAMKILEAAGYACCRSAASLGVFDVIAIGPQGVRLVQVKTNRTAPPHEREAIKEFKCHPICSKELWIFYDYQRQPSITVM